MILTCPNCSTRYLLAARALAPDGRKVKCSNCGEIWFEEPDPDELAGPQQAEDIPESVKPIPEGSSVPVLAEDEILLPRRKPHGRLAAYAVSACIFLLLSGALLALHQPIARAMPGSQYFYALFGYDYEVAGEGLVFDQISATAQQQAGREQIAIEGKIINLTREYRAIPAMQAALRTRAGEIADTWLIAPPKSTLEPGESITFRAVQDNPAPAGASEVNIRFILVPGGAVQKAN